MRDAVFALLWTALLPMAFLSPYVGTLLWVWVALLPPGELFYGFMGSLPYNKIIALITLAVLCVKSDRQDFYMDSSLTLCILLCASATMSYAISIHAVQNTYELYEKLLKMVVLVFVIAIVVSNHYRLHLLIVAVALAYGFLGVKEGLIFLLTAGGHKIQGIMSIGDNNSLATALLMLVPLLYYLARHSAVHWIRVGIACALGLCLVTTIATFSRGGFVGLVVLGALAIANSKQKVASAVIVTIAAALTYTLAPEAWFERLSTIKSAESDDSFLGRVVAWKISWLIAMDSPLFGAGMHAVQRQPVWDTYKHLTDTISIIQTPPVDFAPKAAHSIYFEVLGDLGFVGLGLFLLLIGSAFWNCARVRSLARQRPGLGWASDLARMVQISLIIYLVTGAALSIAYAELLYVVVAISSRCRRTVSQLVEAETAGGTARPRHRQGRQVLAPAS